MKHACMVPCNAATVARRVVETCGLVSVGSFAGIATSEGPPEWNCDVAVYSKFVLELMEKLHVSRDVASDGCMCRGICSAEQS
jgi:hypothetical protein